MTRGCLLLVLLSSGLAFARPSKRTWHKDVVFACEQNAEHCKPLIQIKTHEIVEYAPPPRRLIP